MRLSAKVEYSLKALMALADVYLSKKKMSLLEISSQKNISSSFLLQLMIRMKSANIISSMRGSSGGYFLRRPPEDISVKDIIIAVDHTVLDRNMGDRPCVGEMDKVLVDFWDRFNDGIVDYLEGTSLHDLMQKSSSVKSSFVYSI
ncbi:hypothetical protein AB834_04105 [PVC group bacterium (ex Bugula neritina AB1)]|nr:hypothetical protein AB834_04105 [PVC group bacterium (ex Bugula neritina AB1)]